MNSDFNTRQKNSWAYDLYIIWQILRKLVFDLFDPQKVTETAKVVYSGIQLYFEMWIINQYIVYIEFEWEYFLYEV